MSSVVLSLYIEVIICSSLQGKMPAQNGLYAFGVVSANAASIAFISTLPWLSISEVALEITKPESQSQVSKEPLRP